MAIWKWDFLVMLLCNDMSGARRPTCGGAMVIGSAVVRQTRQLLHNYSTIMSFAQLNDLDCYSLVQIFIPGEPFGNGPAWVYVRLKI